MFVHARQLGNNRFVCMPSSLVNVWLLNRCKSSECKNYMCNTHKVCICCFLLPQFVQPIVFVAYGCAFYIRLIRFNRKTFPFCPYANPNKIDKCDVVCVFLSKVFPRSISTGYFTHCQKWQILKIVRLF